MLKVLKVLYTIKKMASIFREEMVEKTSADSASGVDGGRRAFLNRAGKVGLGVPAIAVLLSVTNKRASAMEKIYKCHNGGCDGKYEHDHSYGYDD